MDIRTRLLLLVFAVWLPAAAGFGLLARATYEREAAAATRRLQQLGQSMNLLVERELDQRAALARALAASRAARELDLARFREEASAAVAGTRDWVVLMNRTHQLVNTLKPPGEEIPLPRAPDAPFVSGGTAAVFTPHGPVTGLPVLALFAAPPGPTPPPYNVAIAFEPAVVQAVLEQHAVPEGGVAAVINERQLLMARSRDPEKWIGRSATGDVQRRALARESGLAESVTLDGVASLTYLTPPSRYGWSIVIAMPQSLLAAAARRVTFQAAGASGLLLLIGLGLALYGARHIATPVLALRAAAARLGQGGVPPPLVTGVREADDVSQALHEAALRSQEATHTLEQRVAQAVRESQEAQARLLDAQKHEAIGRLTGGIAHDFNNLLQTISTAHQVLDRTIDDATQRRLLHGAMRATSRAADLIRQMLAFGRAQPLQPQAVDLNDLILHSRELTGKAVGERVALTAEIEPGLPAVFVDPTQLELAILNLVFNARDAMPEGGRIVISARRATPGEAAALPPGPYVRLAVADNGPGMEEPVRARAFEPYFTTKPVGAGSGLGLPQAQAFARQSGGDITLDSGPGSGTTVSLVLPATAMRSEAAAAREVTAAVPHRPLRVLMVEDDLLVSSVVAPALEREGHRVVLCGTADEAVDWLARAEQVDVVFTDVVMPGRMTGMDLVQWCRAHRPGVPVVVATGYTAQQADAGVAVLRKPYGLDTVLAALQAAAATRENVALR